MKNIKICEICGNLTSFERKDPKTEPPEGDRCYFCDRWVCINCQDWSKQPPPICIECGKNEV